VLCSTVIPTIGRDCLQVAVESALQQQISAEHHEIVVANDSGRALARSPWMEAPQVRIVDTHRSERSKARNAGAEIATGEYLNFLDDDDCLYPNAILALLDAAREQQVSRVIGAYRCVDNSGAEVAFIRPEFNASSFLSLLLAGESLPWGAAVISRDIFFEIGGFDTGLCVREDYDLECRHALIGDVAVISQVVAEFRVGGQGSTDWSHLKNVTHYARAKIMPKRAALTRVWPDLEYDPELAARVFRGYLSTAGWCLRNRRVSDGTAILKLAGQIAAQHFASTQFWRIVAPLRASRVMSLLNGFWMVVPLASLAVV
jgi:glycosyltransferase involved in cell wall biosynthesis